MAARTPRRSAALLLRCLVIFSGSLVLSACQPTGIYSESLVQARGSVLATIPIGTPRKEALDALMALEPREVSSYWKGVPPQGPSSLVATFDSRVFPFWQDRRISLDFSEGGFLEAARVSDSPVIDLK